MFKHIRGRVLNQRKTSVCGRTGNHNRKLERVERETRIGSWNKTWDESTGIRPGGLKYNIFCKVTGYGGTIQVVNRSSNKIGSKNLIVRFDDNDQLDIRMYETENTLGDVLTSEDQ